PSPSLHDALPILHFIPGPKPQLMQRGIFINQRIDTFAGRHLSLVMLLLNALVTSALLNYLFRFIKLFYNFLYLFGRCITGTIGAHMLYILNKISAFNTVKIMNFIVIVSFECVYFTESSLLYTLYIIWVI